ncbi:hypothetical protein [Paenibacillus sp. PAMC21692]|uniref:hypothetical protein n=1 Tax=Paenibacillus sp. PAMC21692 TaxID=2762320 RepID=UPI00164D5DA5|nr:hypothetical protein [Paenibacillus sp. PAMC21692]QNK54714.1 hypothetical protein H7F31_18900 [Paenibacillus sp. PAMC21692]
MEIVKFGCINGKKVRGFVPEEHQIKAVLIISDEVTSISYIINYCTEEKVANN